MDEIIAKAIANLYWTIKLELRIFFERIWEWILLKLNKCPACTAGIWPHRRCILR